MAREQVAAALQEVADAHKEPVAARGAALEETVKRVPAEKELAATPGEAKDAWAEAQWAETQAAASAVGEAQAANAERAQAEADEAAWLREAAATVSRPASPVLGLVQATTVARAEAVPTTKQVDKVWAQDVVEWNRQCRIAWGNTGRGVSAEQATQVVLSVLAAKTGYEPDMIEMDMALETELGVDSIKRVEILSEVQKQLSVEAQDVAALSRTQTVGEVVDAMLKEIAAAGM